MAPFSGGEESQFDLGMKKYKWCGGDRIIGSSL